METLHRSDSHRQFPRYDYLAPNEPWKIDYRRNDNITAAQISSFHYRWACNMCTDSAMVGMSLVMPHMPYCLCVAPKQNDGVHIVSPLENIVNLFEKESVPIIIISSGVSLLNCSRLPEETPAEARKRRSCSGDEIVPVIRSWVETLMPGGVMIAILIDDAYCIEAGWNQFEKAPIKHSWSARRFKENIIEPLSDTLEVLEFDNLHNHFAFNVVLKKSN